MNKALLAKVGWRLIQDHTSLWARVLRSKYKVGDVHNNSWLVAKSNWSSTWRSVCVGLREVVLKGQCWVLGNGRDIRFWTDKWLGNVPLLELVEDGIPENRVNATVGEMWRNGTGWLWERIGPQITEDIRLRLGSMVVDNVTGAADRLSWSGNADGSFTVTSAYALLTENMIMQQQMTSFWSRVWGVVAPERVRTFLWLVGNQAIMTNSERYRRHIGTSALCTVCKGGEETILHVLRDCPAMEGLWRRLVPADKIQNFFADQLLGWIYSNLGENTNDWSTLFAMAVWWGWKWRCGNVFDSNGKCRDRVRFVKDLAKEVIAANVKLSNSHGAPVRVQRMIAWTQPQAGWMRVNTDGASRGNPGLEAAGGVLRDERGEWRGGFSLNIGICSAPLAELWGVYYGLYMAWERRVTRLELEVDSEIVVGFLKTGISATHPLSFLVRLCHGFISRDWIVRVTHVYREANRLADGLANHAFSLPLGFHSFDIVPDILGSILVDDARGTSFPRQICI